MIFKVKIYDLTEIFKETKSKLVKTNIDNGAKVYGIKLDKMKGMIGFEILPNRRIGTEFSDIAKRFGLKGILHSDELPNYGISEEEVKNVKRMLNCSDDDAFILLISKDYEVTKKVFSLIINRINESIKRIPKDTRQANEDGTTSFLRPQPGSERMYPETDHPYIYINKDIIENNEYNIIRYYINYGDIKETFDIYYLKKFDRDLYIKLLNEGKTILNSIDPEFIKQILKSFGYNDKQIENIIWSEYIYDIIKISFDLDPNTVYYLFFQMIGDTENLFKEKIEKFDLDFIYKIKDYLKDKKIVKNAIPIIYYHYVKYNKDIEDIIRENNLYKRNREELKKEIEEYLKSINTNDKKVIFSNVFSKFKYVADSEDIKRVLEEILNI
ncbi:Archaeal Glu-tRNAGln amidotransferase subunit E (contains GAD domain) [Candidatus Nanobsidianus stetteri]|uniref:Archaeal Glu-tRNAGln amidotransferase subunit E (Contains GAD domain) n=1 Tax=Nanobsidianus stetteri TaxID=1294122 RepID=R1G997_NANST|nr:Archaeal Glu-tRNAGln amidotransferase subunit E (contains GAD domain) [Candidatus Nanobsidianus stetteri]